MSNIFSSGVKMCVTHNRTHKKSRYSTISCYYPNSLINSSNRLERMTLLCEQGAIRGTNGVVIYGLPWKARCTLCELEKKGSDDFTILIALLADFSDLLTKKVLIYDYICMNPDIKWQDIVPILPNIIKQQTYSSIKSASQYHHQSPSNSSSETEDDEEKEKESSNSLQLKRSFKDFSIDIMAFSLLWQLEKFPFVINRLDFSKFKSTQQSVFANLDFVQITVDTMQALVNHIDKQIKQDPDKYSKFLLQESVSSWITSHLTKTSSNKLSLTDTQLPEITIKIEPKENNNDIDNNNNNNIKSDKMENKGKRIGNKRARLNNTNETNNLGNNLLFSSSPSFFSSSSSSSSHSSPFSLSENSKISIYSTKSPINSTAISKTSLSNSNPISNNTTNTNLLTIIPLLNNLKLEDLLQLGIMISKELIPTAQSKQIKMMEEIQLLHHQHLISYHNSSSNSASNLSSYSSSSFGSMENTNLNQKPKSLVI